ncbi:MAG: cation:proton antiporter [Gammaproteobacteria bacterium]|nr:cation:proton antiporter [Gammaproteobacteria bacterium]
MQTTAQILLSVGFIFLLGLATDLIGKRTFLPRVTLLLIFGMLIGQEGFDLIPLVVSERLDLISELALLMIGFLLGGRLTKELFIHSGRQILWISISTVISTVIIVILGMVSLGVPIGIAILLGCIASATAPAATVDTVIESKIKTPFANVLLAIVALDDLWALIIFSIGLSLVASINGLVEEVSPLQNILCDIGGAGFLGMVIGLPAAYLTGRIKPGEPMLMEAMGLVLICGGLAMWLEVSFLIASMIMGIVIANLAKHHEYPFHEIENIEWPFMVLFFILAGASLEFSALKGIGLLGLIYIISRVVGKVAGATLGAYVSHSDVMTHRWMGLALLPQAGAAIGMTLIAANQFPEYRQLMLTIVISSTVFFEVLGPVMTRQALRHSVTDKELPG